jgi:hypothetical protein
MSKQPSKPPKPDLPDIEKKVPGPDAEKSAQQQPTDDPRGHVRKGDYAPAKKTAG